MRLWILITTWSLALVHSASADQESRHSGQPVPRFESLKFDLVNARVGPTREHPVAFQYVKAGMPVEIIMETEEWRRVRDPDGVESWIHKSQLSPERTAIVRNAHNEPEGLYKRSDVTSDVVGRAEPGVILAVDYCENGMCKVRHPQVKGAAWIVSSSAWGGERQTPLASVESRIRG